MYHFHLAVANNDIIAASQCYNLSPIDDREDLFIDVLSKNNGALIDVLLPLTPTSENIVKSSIWHKNQRALEFLYVNNYGATSDLLIIAALRDNLNAMVFLHTRGCVWSDDVVNAAITASSVQCCKYAVEVGKCNVGYFTFNLAARRPSCNYYSIPSKINIAKYSESEVRLLEYLHEIGCTGDWDCRYEGRSCYFCLNKKDVVLETLWELDVEENVIQWMPKEVLTELLSLLV